MLEKIKAFSQNHLVLILAVAGSFAAGWYLKPANIRIVESTKTTEIHHETTTIQQKVDLTEFRKMLADSAVQKNVTIIKEVIKAPDGTVTERTRTEDKSTSQVHKTADTSTASKSETQMKRDLLDQKTEEHYKLVEEITPPNNWGLFAQAGVSLPGLTGRDVPNYVPGLPKQLMLGVGIERRILGPIYVGAFVSSRLDTGLQLRVGF
jgi:hypothetical protein